MAVSPSGSRITRRLAGVPHFFFMAIVRKLTTLALARAMLAGPQHVGGLAARLRAALGLREKQPALWLQMLAEHIALVPASQWLRLEPGSLARLIEASEPYRQAWAQGRVPAVRRFILRPPKTQNAPPFGLHQVQLPLWPEVGSLAAWLGVPRAGLWRLAKPAAWQRRDALGQQHYRCQWSPKARGGWRLLEVPEGHLMALQRKLLQGVLAQVPPHEAAMAYATGRSVLDHARAHQGQAVVLCFDLQDFFSSVRTSRVQALWATLGYSTAVARTLTALSTIATPEAVLLRMRQSAGLGWQQAQRLRDAHLPQGAPTSPVLANLCAFRLDLRLEGLAHQLDARYTRYADDIVISGGPGLRQAQQRIAGWVARIALEEGFALNHRKTRVLPAGHRQAVCGVVVNQQTNLPRPEFDRLKALLHQCVMHGPASQNYQGHPAWREHLAGRVAWARQLNPAKAQRLQRLFDQIPWPA